MIHTFLLKAGIFIQKPDAFNMRVIAHAVCPRLVITIPVGQLINYITLLNMYSYIWNVEQNLLASTSNAVCNNNI